MYAYKRLKIANGKTMDEHRIVMSRQLGRDLTSDEIVHHGNRNGKDNRPGNLELTDRSNHAKYHMMLGDLHNIQNCPDGLKRGRETVARLYGKRVMITDLEGNGLLIVRSIKMAAKVCKCFPVQVILILRGERKSVKKTFKFKLA